MHVKDAPARCGHPASEGREKETVMRTVVLALAVLAAPVAAQAEETGAALYRSYCAGCHGVAAAGDGPLAALLTVPTPDLTALAARNGGEFPLADVVRIIDGRRLFQAHGGPMPVFGPMMGGGSAVLDGPDGAVLQTRGDVLKIARFLVSLQDG